MISSPYIVITYKDGTISYVHINQIKTAPNYLEASTITENFYKHLSQSSFSSDSDLYFCFTLYDVFHKNISIPYTQYRDFLAEKLLTAKFVRLTNLSPQDLNLMKAFLAERQIPYEHSNQLSFKLKSFLVISAQLTRSLILTAISFLSILLIATQRKKRLGIWTGDMIKGSGDPRLGNFYKYLYEQNTPFVEFVRTTNFSLSQVLRHFIKRKRPVIYYSDLAFLWPLKPLIAPYPDKRPLENPPNDLAVPNLAFSSYQRIVSYFYNQVRTLKKIYSFLKITKLMPWFFSSRTAPLIKAAKELDLPVIGIMHGMSNLILMRHEFMPEFPKNRLGPIGISMFGVWSQRWKEYYEQYSNIYPDSKIRVSGPLRPPYLSQQAQHLKNKDKENGLYKVLLISENLSPPQEILPYIKEILDINNVELNLKVRDFSIDNFHQNLRNFSPQTERNMGIVSKPIDEAITNADLVIGTHSTAVIESVIYDTPFLTLKTKTFGNFFSIDNEKYSLNIFVQTPTELKESLANIEKIKRTFPYNEIKENFFGNSDGAKWLAKECIIEVK